MNEQQPVQAELVDNASPYAPPAAPIGKVQSEFDAYRFVKTGCKLYFCSMVIFAILLVVYVIFVVYGLGPFAQSEMGIGTLAIVTLTGLLMTVCAVVVYIVGLISLGYCVTAPRKSERQMILLSLVFHVLAPVLGAAGFIVPSNQVDYAYPMSFAIGTGFLNLASIVFLMMFCGSVATGIRAPKLRQKAREAILWVIAGPIITIIVNYVANELQPSNEQVTGSYFVSNYPILFGTGLIILCFVACAIKVLGVVKTCATTIQERQEVTV